MRDRSVSVRAGQLRFAQQRHLTLWLSADARDAWRPSPSGQPGGQQRFSDLAITTALTLRLVFRLPLRQAEGFVRSVLSLMDVDLEAPDHTTLSRRSRYLDVELHRGSAKGPMHLIVDSTGLSIVGEGEWAAAKHGGRGQRGWKKLHLGVDGSGVIVAQTLTDAMVDDATTGIAVIEALDADIARVTADAAYDTIAFYETATARGATVVVPPDKTARVSPRGPRTVERPGSHDHEDADDRSPAVEAGGGLSSAGPGRQRLLSVQSDHRRWSSCALSRRATDRGGDRAQHPESDDRAWSARVVQYWPVSGLSVGTIASQFRFMHQRLNQMTARGKPVSYGIGR